MLKNNVAIIGAGPAGLTAAIYLVRSGFSVMVFEKKAVGGQIVGAGKIDNYPGVMGISGAELAGKIEQQARALGARIVYEEVISIGGKAGDFTIGTDENTYEVGLVVLATGAADRKLGLPREDVLIGRGVSYCTACDGYFYRDKEVAIIGRGNTALDGALYLAKICRKVYLVNKATDFTGDSSTVQKLKDLDNVEFILEANATELIGDSQIGGVKVKLHDGTERTLAVSGIFLAIGHAPVAKSIKMDVALDKDGYIETTDGVHTSVAGIYVAGDARRKSTKQLVTAMGDGAEVANAIRRQSQ